MIYDGFMQIGLPIIIAVAAVFVAFVVTFIAVFFYRKNSKKKDNDEFALLIKSLGGRDNILTVSCSRSRITLKLNNPALIDRNSLKECGVTSVITMSEKISLVFGHDAGNTANRIQNLLQ